SRPAPRGPSPLTAQRGHARPRAGGPPTGRPAGLSDGADLLGLRPLGTLADRELDLLALLEGPVPVSLDGAEVDEDVRPSIGLGDEPEALLGVEPLDGALGHACSCRDVRDGALEPSQRT